MKKNYKLVLNIFIILLCFIFIPRVNAASYDVYTVKYKCPVREKASDKSNIIKSGNDDIKVVPNQSLEYIKTELGPNSGKNNQTWYAVKFDYAAREYTGYVAKACMNEVKTYSYNDDEVFEESIKSFPESYKSYLRILHAIHPSWNFKADLNKLKWAEALESESQKGTSAISHLYPSLIFKDEANPDGIIVDGTSWYAPAKDAVAYYMDPRNFLNEKNIFMFEKLSYDEKENSSVQNILNGSFMEGEFTEEGKNKSYANAFIEAAKESNVSSVHLASRSLLEMGTKMSSAASGTVPGYEGYYNFYNIGAYSGEDNYLKGLEYAKNKEWNSIQKAITGGAIFIGSSYINKGQDTLYFQKFNVSSSRKYNAYTHQYQTNIMAPTTEASSIYESYKENNKLNESHTFIIPVYDNMTNTAYKVSRTDTVGGTNPEENKPTEEEKEDVKEENKNEEQKPEEPKEEVKPVEPVIPPEEKVAKAGYSLATGYLTNVAYKSDISVVKNNIINQKGNVGSMNSLWQTKVSGIISTGDLISVDEKVYQVVIYGDPSGDGVISIKDLLLVQKYLLKSQSLDGAFNKAADVSKDNTVTIKDLLLIQKYLLGTGTINQ